MEIEFRGIRKNEGERMCLSKWVYGYYFQSWEDGYILWGTTNGIPNMIEVIPETVGMYVGIRDVNGQKIYDGDIVNITGGRARVEYVEEYWYAFLFIDIDTGECFHLYEFDDVEVIGNIHTSEKERV
jgi:hypothetical protein